jgi:hypothetical protein
MNKTIIYIGIVLSALVLESCSTVETTNSRGYSNNYVYSFGYVTPGYTASYNRGWNNYYYDRYRPTYSKVNGYYSNNLVYNTGSSRYPLGYRNFKNAYYQGVTYIGIGRTSKYFNGFSSYHRNLLDYDGQSKYLITKINYQNGQVIYKKYRHGYQKNQMRCYKNQ